MNTVGRVKTTKDINYNLRPKSGPLSTASLLSANCWSPARYNEKKFAHFGACKAEELAHELNETKTNVREAMSDGEMVELSTTRYCRIDEALEIGSLRECDTSRNFLFTMIGELHQNRTATPVERLHLQSHTACAGLRAPDPITMPPPRTRSPARRFTTWPRIASVSTGPRRSSRASRATET